MVPWALGRRKFWPVRREILVVKIVENLVTLSPYPCFFCFFTVLFYFMFLLKSLVAGIPHSFIKKNLNLSSMGSEPASLA
jgi:hypothetical protein